MNELISIIVPIYNVEKYLEKCLRSIINQTYKNIEIILVDDGSPDKCGIICDEYSHKDHRINVIHKRNGGLSDARNAGIEVSKGDYILFVDSDDYINLRMVELLYESIKKHSADIAVCRYKSILDNEVVDISEVDDSSESFIIEESEYLNNKEYYSDRRVEFIVAWNKLYARKLFKEIRYPKGKIHEDEFTTYKLLYYAEKIVYVPQELYYYVQRSNSIMSVGISKSRLLGLDALDQRMDFYEKNNKIGFWKREFENYRRSYLKYLGSINNSSDLCLRDFDRYKKIYLRNMRKYFSKINRPKVYDLKIILTGLCPYTYAKLLGKKYKA